MNTEMYALKRIIYFWTLFVFKFKKIYNTCISVKLQCNKIFSCYILIMKVSEAPSIQWHFTKRSFKLIPLQHLFSCAMNTIKIYSKHSYPVFADHQHSMIIGHYNVASHNKIIPQTLHLHRLSQKYQQWVSHQSCKIEESVHMCVCREKYMQTSVCMYVCTSMCVLIVRILLISCVLG